MSTTNERVKRLRKALKLSQVEFAKAAGLTQSAISDIERGKARNVTKSNMIAICSKFNVNEEWLRDGIGDIFVAPPDDAIDQIAVDYHLNQEAKLMIRHFVKLNEVDRNIVVKFLTNLSQSL